MIYIHQEDVSFEFMFTDERCFEWLSKVCAKESFILEELNLIFCSDEYLLGVNKEHLNHDYYTDIITFDYCTKYNESTQVIGDLFISIDRVKDNALLFDESFENELFRVISHGVLHLCGYSDKTDEEKVIMKRKESEALLLL
jgi:probable rRNA maturation factor